MFETEARKSRKIVKKIKHPQFINILKQFEDATPIKKLILDLELILTFEESLASALAIKKQLTNAIMKEKNVRFWVNNLE